MKKEIIVLLSFIKEFPTHYYSQSGDKGQIRHRDLIIECKHADYQQASEIYKSEDGISDVDIIKRKIERIQGMQVWISDLAMRELFNKTMLETLGY